MAPHRPGVVPGVRHRPEVVLRVWGATDADRRGAEEVARNHHSLYGYRIASVEQVDEPIPARGNYAAIAYGANYYRTWAAYPLVVEQSGDAAA